MKIFEIGVGEYWQSRTLKYINTDNECWLFEPHPIFYKNIYDKLKEHKNFKVFNYALGDCDKEVDLCLAEDASFIKDIKAPFANKQNALNTTRIQVKDINRFDPGDIDVILLDVEGAEFDILKNMKSRPKHIVVEMYSFGVNYKNPNFDEIIRWMLMNKYTLTNEPCPWPDVRGAFGEDFYFIKN